MSHSQNQLKISEEEEECLLALEWAAGSVVPMALRAAIELNILEIMAKASPGAQLSSSDIASHLATQNPDAPSMIDRLLRLLASFNIVTCSLVTDVDGRAQRLYGLGPICKFYIRKEGGGSIAPLSLFLQDKVVMDCWYHFKDAVLEGGIPFNRAHGMHAFAYPAKDSRFNEVFNNAMSNFTTLTMEKILDTYQGFEGIKEVVDVGGGIGASLCTIISKYPNIKGINFDLPHVLREAPTYPGVEHIGGDMFTTIPKGEVIFMKLILHDWSDDDCLTLLKNCWEALKEDGKVIVVESVLPEYPETDLLSRNVFLPDMSMLIINPGGKERTKKEFEALATSAGFAATKFICRAYTHWVIEFHKTI